ncbi:uncharacterized protein TNIN_500461 [Trichonephila inaurata madagascariensis]|uniref:Uncharacterized protein n=1 Tax=Trichonephila inaurata madagascariensis TaxID=2747483 RepID=A0A8X7CAB1_9ARAC|nr:uncharacterized protein TNIN_500461 [Trichonephila inaurata madagascariensis]
MVILETSEFHVFVDASKKAYAACIFVRSVNLDGVKVTLVRAKSRVAALKTLNIPHLKLMACCTGARLANFVRNTLDLPDIKVMFRNDSSVALWWIREHRDWSVFVTNRVKEIRQLTRPQLWHHVPGNINLADLLSRGSNWLLMPLECWPLDNVCFYINETRGKEKKNQIK